MGILRFSHVGVCVSDLQRAAEFYRDALGFQQISEISVAGEPADTLLQMRSVALRAVYLERDGMRIELLHFESPQHLAATGLRPMNQLGLTHFSLRVDDLNATLETLRTAGVNIVRQSRIDVAEFGVAAVFVSDPDGTLIELVQSPGDPARLPGA